MEVAMRKAFNFYKSFYDVYKELSKTDRVEFMDALLERQFEGKEPIKLKGMAKFAYKSQEQVINQQIQGWETKTGYKLTAIPCQGGYGTPIDTPSVQEEEQGKGEEQEEEQGKRKKFTPPKLQEVKDYFKEKGYTVESAEKAFNYYDIADWKDSKGNKVKNWKQKMLSVWMKEENKEAEKQPEKPKSERQIRYEQIQKEIAESGLPFNRQLS